MSVDQDITDSINFLQQSFAQAVTAKPDCNLTSSIINQSPKTAFRISDQNVSGTTGLKLLLVFNSDTAKCYIKHYHQIPQGTDASCAVCPQEEVDCNDLPKIGAALNNLFASHP